MPETHFYLVQIAGMVTTIIAATWLVWRMVSAVGRYVTKPPAPESRPGAETTSQLREGIDSLHERVDFLERVMAQREYDRLGGPSSRDAPGRRRARTPV